MATFLELQTRVRTRVIDLPAAVSAEVPTLVNAAMRQLQSKHNFKVMEKLATATTVEGLHFLMAKPADFKEPREGDAAFRLSNTGQQNLLVWAAGRTGALGMFGDQDTGPPRLLLDAEPTNALGERNWEVFPLPDGNSDWNDGEYRVFIPYYGYVPALVNNGDTNWFTNVADEWIIMQATAEAFAVDWDEQRLAVWAQLAQAKFAEVVRADKLLRVAGVADLVPHIAGGYSPTVRL